MYLRRIVQSPARFKFIFDPDNEAALRLNVTPARTCADLAAATETGLAVYDYSAMFPGQRERAFLFFSDYCYTVAGRLPGLKLFCCDELQKFIGCRDDQYPQEFKNVVEEGRRATLDCLFVARSTNVCNTRLRNELTEIVLFRQLDERAVKFSESLGGPTEDLRCLPVGTFYTYKADEGKWYMGKEF